MSIETGPELSGALLSKNALITEIIGSHVLVDIGHIQTISETGFATVSTGRSRGGKLITYSNVELMYIGNQLGAIQVAPAGSMCLLFCPKTVMPSTDSGDVVYTAPPYSIMGMKAIPLTHGKNTKCSMGITPSGGITFSGGTFSAEVSTDGLVVYSAEGTTQMTIDTKGGVSQSYGKGLIRKFIGADGAINEVRFSSDGKVMYFEKYELDGTTTVKRISKEPVKLSELNGYSEWASVNTYLPDGTITDDTNNNSGFIVRDADGNIVSQLTLAQDGNSTIMGTTAVTLDCNDADGNDQSEVKVDAEGNVTVTAMKTLTIDVAEGKFVLEVSDTGTLSITASQECTITDGSNTIAMSSSGIEVTDVSGNAITTSATGFEVADAAGNKITSSPASLEMASVAGTKITLGPIVQIG